MTLALPNLPNTNVVQCRGKYTKFPGRPGSITVPVLPRTLATGDLYPDNVDIMSIFNFVQHILVSIEVSAAVCRMIVEYHRNVEIMAV